MKSNKILIVAVAAAMLAQVQFANADLNVRVTRRPEARRTHRPEQRRTHRRRSDRRHVRPAPRPYRPVVGPTRPVIVAPPRVVPNQSRVWVPAVYETRYVTERVWVAPVYEKRLVRERVWVQSRGCRGRWECRTRTVNVLIREGYWDTRTVARRVLVREGYWRVLPERGSGIRVHIQF